MGCSLFRRFKVQFWAPLVGISKCPLARYWNPYCPWWLCECAYEWDVWMYVCVWIAYNLKHFEWSIRLEKALYKCSTFTIFTWLTVILWYLFYSRSNTIMYFIILLLLANSFLHNNGVTHYSASVVNRLSDRHIRFIPAIMFALLLKIKYTLWTCIFP